MRFGEVPGTLRPGTRTWSAGGTGRLAAGSHGLRRPAGAAVRGRRRLRQTRA